MEIRWVKGAWFLGLTNQTNITRGGCVSFIGVVFGFVAGLKLVWAWVGDEVSIRWARG